MKISRFFGVCTLVLGVVLALSSIGFAHVLMPPGIAEVLLIDWKPVGGMGGSFFIGVVLIVGGIFLMKRNSY